MTLDTTLLKNSWRCWVDQTQECVGPAWLQWLWTLLFSAFIAAAFTLMGLLFGPGRGVGPEQWLEWYARNLVISLTVGVLIHLLYDVGGVGDEAAHPRVGDVAARAVYFSTLPIVGVAVGWPLGATLAGFEVARWLRDEEGRVIISASLAVSVVATLVVYQLFAAKSRQYQAEREAAEAQLRLLQGQIEPHFLFNTLANVQSLVDADPTSAKLMLERFTDYLRASLTQLRGESTTLAHEFATLQAYLGLMQLRMGRRLRVRLDLPDALAGFALPPLLMQPLVENAIHHGLEPQVAGGEIAVTARRDGERVLIDVEDDGQGLDGPRRRPGNGVALANIRERLLARWGGAATLTLLPRDGGGTRARLTLPATE